MGLSQRRSKAINGPEGPITQYLWFLVLNRINGKVLRPSDLKYWVITSGWEYRRYAPRRMKESSQQGRITGSASK